jgi:hypothetical protein
LWISSEDIDKGQRWHGEVGSKLETLGQGILCVTAENQREPWLNFEAGALAKSLDGARVRPVLFGLKPADVTGPLAQFQATVATDHDDMLRLVSSLNDVCETPLNVDRLKRSFDRLWNDYLTRLSAIPTDPGDSAPGRRSAEDMIAEVLDRMRDLQRSMEPTEVDLSPDRVFVLSDGTVLRQQDPVRHPEYGPGRLLEFRWSWSKKIPRAAVSFADGVHIVPVGELKRGRFAALYPAGSSRADPWGELLGSDPTEDREA